MIKLGIIGGTFDPPHFGHLAIAEEAYARLGLTRVLFAPAYGNPLKQSEQHSDTEQRLQMVRLAIADNPHFSFTSVDLRPGPSYTVVLLQRMRVEHPDAEFYFIIGADAIARLPDWYQAERVLEMTRMVAFPRPIVSLDLPSLIAAMPRAAERVQLITDGPLLEISSRQLRERIAASLPIHYQTPDAVIEYIAEQRLYK